MLNKSDYFSNGTVILVHKTETRTPDIFYHGNHKETLSTFPTTDVR